MSFSEEQIRHMIREEMKELLNDMAMTAYNAVGYDTRELETAAFRAIQTHSEMVGDYLPHGWKCPKREGARDNHGDPTVCTCVSEKEEVSRVAPIDLEIGKISNLITDITLAGGSKEDLEKAILHSQSLLALKKMIRKTDIEDLIEKYSK